MLLSWLIVYFFRKLITQFKCWTRLSNLTQIHNNSFLNLKLKYELYETSRTQVILLRTQDGTRTKDLLKNGFKSIPNEYCNHYLKNHFSSINLLIFGQIIPEIKTCIILDSKGVAKNLSVFRKETKVMEKNGSISNFPLFLSK